MAISNGNVLIVAGSDSGGGAGIQADIKTVTALGGYAATAITALTAQNTQGVQAVLGIDPEFIRQQMQAVLDDITINAIKTGMLHEAPVIATVAEVLKAYRRHIPIVVDPVMIAQSGDPLLAEEAIADIAEKLLPLATVLTPNLPEAEKLLGREIGDVEAMRAAALELAGRGPQAVLLKGGHLLEGGMVTDVLASRGGVEVFADPRIETRHTHGTGCTLASAIATGLAQDLSVGEAVARARRYLRLALATARPLGKGQGPVNHGHTVRPFF
ncbi:MAG: bifunctional hydroxymethylpyrimidine kinase/phosphomethylpyrimidine kinase [Rhodovibrionaceae bacterium]